MGADPQGIDFQGQTPLHIAIRFNYSQKVVSILAEKT
jgi:ankyrin repeat protein